MTTAAIGKILDSYLTDVEGQSGFWRGTRDEITVYVMSDDAHDRVRIMAPIGELKLVQNTGTTYASSDLVFMAHGDDAPGDREEHGGDPGAPPLREGPESE